MSMNGSVLPAVRSNSGCISEFKSTTSCLKLHLNNLWSIWYGILLALFNGYIAFQCTKRFYDYMDLPWPSTGTPSRKEMEICIGLTGFSVLLIPFLLCAAVFKIGNLANDGFKLGRNLSTCSSDPATGMVDPTRNGCKRIWQHCGPISSLLHLLIAFCLLIPKLIIEARMIQAGFLPKDSIWKSDLDFIIPHRDPAMVLNFTYGSTSYNNYNTSQFISTTTTEIPPSPRNLPLLVAAGREINIEDNTNIASISIEFINYAIALFAYSVRYPSVFWATNKCFGILFSIQLFINGIQCLIMHAGICVLYKVHVIGRKEMLPYLNIRVSKVANRWGSPFALNEEVTLALYIMATVLILVSSLVLYLYGYGRLNAFLAREKARRIITLNNSSNRTWGYFTHCAALCVLVAIGVVEAPLLYDYTLIYRGSMNSIVLTVILSTILHLFIWVLLWLILTLKQHWEFKLRVTVGHATVRSAPSIKLVTDVHLVSSNNNDPSNAPLLVVGHGRTYTVSETSSKRAIMTLIQKAALDKKTKNQGSGGKGPSDDSEEQVYWLRPKSRTPRTSPDSSCSESKIGWFTKKKNIVACPEEMSPFVKSNGKRQTEEDGDYVRLREVTHMSHVHNSRGENSDDTTSEDNKILECVRNDMVTYASVNKNLLNPTNQEYEDPSPLLTPEPHDHDDLPPPPPELTNVTMRCMSLSHGSPGHQDVGKYLHRTDSGMPVEENPSRSDSEVSGGSPPDRNCSNSETSSGIHSNSSRESESNHKIGELNTGNVLRETAQKIPPQQWLLGNIHPGLGYNFGRLYKPQQLYASVNKTPVINEVAEENTVVIRRKNIIRPEGDMRDPFGRSTNMRLTSFTDSSDVPKLASTLPHYPTQPIGVAYPHCSTMPLPINLPTNGMLMNGNSCGSFPRPHTTIPTHQNTRNPIANPYIKRLLPDHISNTTPSHHTFPQLTHQIKPQSYMQRHQERDSANFSISSSACDST